MENELGLGRAESGQITQQLESPVVLVTGEQLPAPLLLVVVAPNPIAAGMLGGEEARRLVQRNDLVALRRRIESLAVGRLALLEVLVRDVDLGHELAERELPLDDQPAADAEQRRAGDRGVGRNGNDFHRGAR